MMMDVSGLATADEQAAAAARMTEIMPVPGGFLADLDSLGMADPTDDKESDNASGWFLYVEGSDVPIDTIGERGGIDRGAVTFLMVADGYVNSVQLWRGLECVWAAVRDAA